MYAKVINPKTNGKKVYTNKAGSQRCVNYLVQEAAEDGKVAQFFGGTSGVILTALEVVELLDTNVKGLTKETDKFHSLVLSPSSEELVKINNDTNGLQEFTRNVMDLYAKNFTLKNGRELGEPDLVWAAIIHQNRKIRGTDEGPQGEKKEGLQTHIHIVVSARDAEQKISLNPLGMADRFYRVQFQAQANVQMEVQFGRVGPNEIARPNTGRAERVAEKAQDIKEKAAAGGKEKKPLTAEKMADKDARLLIQVARMNTKLHPLERLDPLRVQLAAKERNYDNIFYNRLGKIERAAEAGNYTPSPHQYLSTGRVVPLPALRVDGAISNREMQTPTYPTHEKSPVIHGGGASTFQLALTRLAQTMKLAGRAQDVRSEAEKERDNEMEI